MKNIKFEDFERDVMEKIFDGAPEISDILKAQYACAKVVSREFTGAGFFTNFEVTDKNLKLMDDTRYPLACLAPNFDGLEYGAGFILFIKDGVLSFLEGYTYCGDKPWPTEITGYTLE